MVAVSLKKKNKKLIFFYDHKQATKQKASLFVAYNLIRKSSRFQKISKTISASRRSWKRLSQRQIVAQTQGIIKQPIKAQKRKSECSQAKSMHSSAFEAIASLCLCLNRSFALICICFSQFCCDFPENFIKADL